MECKETGWKVRVYPVEDGCQGFVGKTTLWCWHGRPNLWKAVKELGGEEEKAIFWLTVGGTMLR